MEAVTNVIQIILIGDLQLVATTYSRFQIDKFYVIKIKKNGFCIVHFRPSACRLKLPWLLIVHSS